MSATGSARFIIWCAAIALVSSIPLIIVFISTPELPLNVVNGTLFSFAIAIIGVAFLAYRTERTLRLFEDATARFAQGDFESLLEEPKPGRLGALVTRLNTMATQLDKRVQALSKLSREQDAILRSMTEGVMTVDSEGKIHRVNEAARSLLGISRAYVESCEFSEIVRHPEIQKFVHDASASMLPKTSTVTLRQDPEIILDLYGSPLFQDDGSSSGTLIVFRDMTRVHKLENVRRDFVANVSHELRTPITSIKGFAETLLEGAMNEPESLKKFVAIIGRHAERLSAIFNDLLTLAKLESGSGEERVLFAPHRLSTLVGEALDACSNTAVSKNIQTSCLIPGDVKVVVNPSLVQQALVNLIDNAIKYSDPGAKVTVTAEIQGDFVRCMVSDTGPGIESGHLPRLFERFYRVEQGRSRQMGGTGLGLAIVKHIAHVHGGRVDVQSTLGQGSTFSIYLKTR